MERTSDISPHRGTDIFAAALAAGRTVADAAAEAGISERTAYRRLADEGVQRQIRDARAALFARAFGLISDSMAAAVATLVRNLETGPPAVQVRAAVALLEQAAKLRATEELERRVGELEAMLAGQEASRVAA